MSHNPFTLGAVLAFAVAGNAFAGTSLSCAGYPRSYGSFVQVCKITKLTAPLTPSLNVISNSGNLTAHGGEKEETIPVYARIVAQDATLADATKLANSVDISDKNDVVSSQKITVEFPRSLEIDYEVFTPAATDLSLSTGSGNVRADHYTSKLNAATGSGDIYLQTIDGDVLAKTSSGDISLHTVNGNVSANTSSGSITVSLSGADWVGTGLTATTKAGNILLSRPEGYRARITATADVGEVEVDGKTKSFPFPATITTGSGQPIKLTTHAGDVTVRTN